MRKFLKKAEGFTLVELVVVIAILGILAGVGTVGYSGYVKHAQKKADQTLVSNIVRAIEVGTNSTMFTPPESIAATATTYPVGFIVLNADGGKTITSNTAYNGNVTDACEFSEPMEITYLEEKLVARSSCTDGKKDTVYTKKTKTISYCLTHSKGTVGKGENNKYALSWSCSESGSGCSKKHTATPNYMTFDGTENFIANIDTLYVASNGGKCQLAANPGLVGNTATSTAITSNDVAVVTDSHVLSQAVRAAFGDSADLSLQYDGWGVEEGYTHNYSTFYTYAPNLMTDIKTMGNTVMSLQGIVDMGLTKDYDSTEEMIGSFAKELTTKYPDADAWVAVWMDVDSGPIKNGFGLAGRENYSAARLGYNRAFVSYMESRGASNTAINKVKDYVEGVNADLGLPLNICDKAFDANEDNNIVSKFGSDTTALQECKDLYDAYKNSEVCRENGRTFYNTMVTIRDTHGAASDTESTGYSYFDYYDSYLTAMSNLYKKAQEESGEGIMIAVTMENGVVKCDVSPASADLRKQ